MYAGRLLASACALAGALAAACSAGQAQAAQPCAAAGYSYGGVVATQRAHGVAAALTALADPAVEGGHVAAWVGVGGAGEGPGGADEWLQVGLNSTPGSGHRLYYEFARPGEPIQYVGLGPYIASGRTLRVAVLEMRSRPDFWRVWVDGSPVSEPILLPHTNHHLTPIATAESWDGGTPACNRYVYRFDRVVLAQTPGGVWREPRGLRVRQDAGHLVVRAGAGFVSRVGSEPQAVA